MKKLRGFDASVWRKVLYNSTCVDPSKSYYFIVGLVAQEREKRDRDFYLYFSLSENSKSERNIFPIKGNIIELDKSGKLK